MKTPVGVLIDGVSIDFTIKGADPNNKLPADARCGTCDRLIAEHSKEQIHDCAKKQQELKSGV